MLFPLPNADPTEYLTVKPGKEMDLDPVITIDFYVLQVFRTFFWFEQKGLDPWTPGSDTGNARVDHSNYRVTNKVRNLNVLQ